MSANENFLKRWSRLKTEQKEKLGSTSSTSISNSQEAALTPSEEKERQDKLLSELPPVDSLTKDSDFTAFLRKEVPEALRQQALRKLWATDPAIAGPDPLDFQNIDYTKLVTDEVVTSSYEIGKGFADRLDTLAAEDPAAAKSGKGEAAAKDAAAPDQAPEPDQAKEADAKSGSGDRPQRRT